MVAGVSSAEQKSTNQTSDINKSDILIALSQQIIDHNKYYDRTQAAAAQFMRPVAGDQCFKPSSHRKSFVLIV
jgi:hypothetical protein